MSVTATNNFDDSEVQVPEHIVERTEALLDTRPPTNQSLVLETATWWFSEVGNCPIYRWCIHYLNNLEHDEMNEISVYSDARNQADALGMDV